MNIETHVDVSTGVNQQYVSIAVGPVEITAKWPRIMNRKVESTLEQIEEATQSLRRELE